MLMVLGRVRLIRGPKSGYCSHVQYVLGCSVFRLTLEIDPICVVCCMPIPIYTPENTKVAYQLNWSLGLFFRNAFQVPADHFKTLREVTEQDSVRILEHWQPDVGQLRFLLSTQPQVAPSDAIRSVKGRLQYLLRDSNPKLFRRNYNMVSVGETSNDRLNAYVAKQAKRHPMADPLVQKHFESLQFFDSNINLKEVRYSSHGQFNNNLHIVIESRDHLHNVDQRQLSLIRSMIVRACQKKQQLLSRIGMVSNHLHLLLGCDVTSSPQAVALSLMNNMAYAIGMKALSEFSYYVGTFGSYNRDAIRQKLMNR